MRPKSNKRSLQAARTRRAIYDCALRLFYEKGFDNVTVDEVAEAAGVSIGAFYHYFKGKYEIFAIFHETLDEKYELYYQEMMRDPQKAARPVVENIEEFMIYANAVSVSNGLEYIRVVYPNMLCNADFGASMQDKRRLYFNILRQFGEEGLRRGEFRDGFTVEDLLRDCTIISRGCIVDWCIGGGVCDIREHSRTLLRDYLRGISKAAQ